MNAGQIILTTTVFLAGCHPWWSQQVVPAAPPMPYPMTSAPVVVGPPYVLGEPAFQAPQQMPVYPPGSTGVPLPSQTPGSIFGPPAGTPVVAGPAVGSPQPGVPPGAVVGPPGVPGAPPAVPIPPSTVVVPVVDEELAWD